MTDSEAAGSRLPKPFKKTFYDKMPEWFDQYKANGMSETQIKERLQGKTEKYIGKWGNTSKVGLLINSSDDNDYQRQVQQRLVMSPRN